jgi:hypothetical protein
MPFASVAPFPYDTAPVGRPYDTIVAALWLEMHLKLETACIVRGRMSNDLGDGKV